MEYCITTNGPVWLLVNHDDSITRLPMQLKVGGETKYVPLFTSSDAAFYFVSESRGILANAMPSMINTPANGAELLTILKQQGVTRVKFDGTPDGIESDLTPDIAIEDVIVTFRRMAG